MAPNQQPSEKLLRTILPLLHNNTVTINVNPIIYQSPPTTRQKTGKYWRNWRQRQRQKIKRKLLAAAAVPAGTKIAKVKKESKKSKGNGKKEKEKSSSRRRIGKENTPSYGLSEAVNLMDLTVDEGEEEKDDGKEVENENEESEESGEEESD